MMKLCNNGCIYGRWSINQPPEVRQFTLPEHWIGLNVPIYIFEVTPDSNGNKYLVTTTSDKPSEMDQRWTSTKPKSINFKNLCPEDMTDGCKRIAYAWLKTLNGSISEAAVATVKILNPKLHLSVTLTEAPQHYISNNLFSVHFVYSEDKDEFYNTNLVNATGKFAEWVKSIGSGVARYPGGTVVKYWSWERPTGVLKCDRWDTHFTMLTEAKDQEACYIKNQNGEFTGIITKDDSEFTDLEEYLKFVEESGVIPLIGVNILSGIRFDKVGASVWRARRQATYLVSKGKTGAYYYLGNEDMGDVNLGLTKICAPAWQTRYQGKSEEKLVNELCSCFTNPINKSYAKKAACNLRIHARAIKSVDPDAKIVWNDNVVNTQSLSDVLSVTKDFLDGVESHSKWPYSGDVTCDGLPPYTLAMWQNQFPLKITRALCDESGHVYSSKEDPSFTEQVTALRNKAKELGKNNFLLANNEWGLTPGGNIFVDFNRFHYSLAMTEYLQNLIVSGMDMAALWQNIVALGSRQYSMTKLMDAHDKQLKLNPIHYTLEMLKTTKGKGLYPIKNGNNQGSGFIAYDGFNKAQIFLLNKSSENSPIIIKLESDRIIESLSAESLVDDINDNDHLGKLQTTDTAIAEDHVVLVNLPPLSYTKINVSMHK